jgi:SPW repeat
MWKSALIGITGLWLLAAPFVLPDSTSQVYNNWLVGLIVTIAALVMSSQRVWERPIATAAGVWLFICGFVPSLLRGTALVDNDIVVGAVLIIAALSARSHLRQELATLDRLGILPEARV